MLKYFFLVFYLAVLPSFLLCSEENYYITEIQLQQLEQTFQLQKVKLEEQKKIIEQQSASIENLRNSLRTAQNSLEKSEDRNSHNKILYGTGGFLMGAGTMLVISFFSK